MSSKRFSALALLITAGWPVSGLADSTEARCDIYPKGSDRLDKMVRCTFSQRQGYITIARADGITYELAPVGDRPGNFRDQNGRPVYRQSGLGEMGQIFRFEDISLFVYWETVDQKASAQENYTAPFATKWEGGNYDATTRLRCKAAGDSEFGSCPAGILRMEGRQASIVIQSQLGQQFTINFMADHVNATVGKVDARLVGDTWIVTRDNGEVYEVPLAAIEGG
jgi:hypothetical protein